jgi:salicylate hydroxylase
LATISQSKGGERQTIVVIGAGIGGLTAALALSAAGFRVIIAERSEHLSEAGAGIQLSPNAGRALAKLGLDEAVAASAMEPAAIDIRSGTSGDVIASIPISAFRQRYDFPYRVIHRADLQKLLVEALRGDFDITLELSATVPQTMPQGDGLLVRIKMPTRIDVVPAVAIIAADGVWSSFREQIPGSARPTATGSTAWRAIVAADVASELIAMDRTGLWMGRDAHLVHYPVARGSALNIVAIVREQWEKQGWSAVGDRADIASRFKEWPEQARRLLAAPISWQKFAVMKVDPHGAWTHDRMALLGDAAHAMVPYLAQGGTMAMEDALVLADALRGATDIPAALRAYEAVRKERIARVAEAADQAGSQYHYGGMMAFARDASLKFAGERLVLERNDWIYRWKPPEANDGPTI